MSSPPEIFSAVEPEPGIHTGRILKWTDDRGFGFILPENGGDTVFVHISGFESGPRRPLEGDVVYYQLARDHGRTKAVNVRIKGLPLPNTATVAYWVAGLLLAVYFLNIFGIVRLSPPLTGYLVMSIVTFGFYYVDKKRSEEKRWRITGTTLHVLEAIGGWPGAVIAIALLRHMTRKIEHLQVLAAIVVIHLAAWAVWWFRNAL